MFALSSLIFWSSTLLFLFGLGHLGVLEAWLEEVDDDMARKEDGKTKNGKMGKKSRKNPWKIVSPSRCGRKNVRNIVSQAGGLPTALFYEMR